MKSWYVPGEGVRVSFSGPDYGFNVLLPDGWTIAAIENYLHELMEFYEVA